MTIKKVAFDFRGDYLELSDEEIFDIDGGPYAAFTHYKRYTTDDSEVIKGDCKRVTIFNGNTGAVLAEYIPAGYCDLLRDDVSVPEYHSIQHIARDLEHRFNIPRPIYKVYRSHPIDRYPF